MREVNKTIEVNSIVKVNKTIKYEDITMYSVNTQNKVITAILSSKDEQQTEINSENFEITGDNYNLLMSDSPSFAPGKPSDDFRREDLFYIIDKIRDEQQTPLNE